MQTNMYTQSHLVGSSSKYVMAAIGRHFYAWTARKMNILVRKEDISSVKFLSWRPLNIARLIFLH